MVDKRTSRRFAADNRAVSAVIGFILIFGILVLLLTVYQAQIVPQQNAQTEFEHFEDSKNELIELRNTISTAGQADVSQFPSVTLGTNYQTRLLTINPAPPAGTLQTSDKHNITIANESSEYDLDISTRFLEYEPGYNEITVGPTRYEHSVLYLDERERGNNVSIIEEQNLVKDGTVRITALQNEFQQTGTNRVTLELYPQDEVNASEFPESEHGQNLTVTVPTQLNGDYWEDSLPDGIFDDFDEEQDDEPNSLNLSVDEDDLEVNTVGIQIEPDEGAATNTDPQGGDNGDNGDNGDTITAESIDDLTQDESSQTQQFTFTLEGTELPNQGEVEIDVSDVNSEGVDYANAEIDSSADGQEEPEIREGGDILVYVAQGGTEGEESITVEDLDVDDGTSQTFDEIQFERQDNDDSDTESFEIAED